MFRITGWQWSATELPVRVDAVVGSLISFLDAPYESPRSMAYPGGGMTDRHAAVSLNAFSFPLATNIISSSSELILKLYLKNGLNP